MQEALLWIINLDILNTAGSLKINWAQDTVIFEQPMVIEYQNDINITELINVCCALAGRTGQYIIW
jgi:hypothetical protein